MGNVFFVQLLPFNNVIGDDFIGNPFINLMKTFCDVIPPPCTFCLQVEDGPTFSIIAITTVRLFHILSNIECIKKRKHQLCQNIKQRLNHQFVSQLFIISLLHLRLLKIANILIYLWI